MMKTIRRRISRWMKRTIRKRRKIKDQKGVRRKNKQNDSLKINDEKKKCKEGLCQTNQKKEEPKNDFVEFFCHSKEALGIQRKEN